MTLKELLYTLVALVVGSLLGASISLVVVAIHLITLDATGCLKENVAEKPAITLETTSSGDEGTY